jgi:GAF domain-containing protein
VVRAFQSISAELRLDRLVGVLLELLVQHSQADRGCLLLVDGTGPAGLRLAAEAETERDRIRVDLHPAGAAPHRVPTRLIEHAGHHQVVLAGNPDELAQYADDPYLAAERPRAAMCAPIVRRDTVLAVLYLEYRRQPTAFSGAYLELLDMLCTQAAIALENATVHARLVEANRGRTTPRARTDGPLGAAVRARSRRRTRGDDGEPHRTGRGAGDAGRGAPPAGDHLDPPA